MPKTRNHASKNHDSASNVSLKRVLVFSFWIVVAVLFMNSYMKLEAEPHKKASISSHEEKEVGYFKQTEKSIVKLVPVCNAVEGIDLKVNSLIEVLDKGMEVVVDISVAKGTVRLSSTIINSSTKNIQLNGHSETVFLDNIIYFRGNEDTTLNLTITTNNNIYNHIMHIKMSSLIETVQNEVSLLIKTHERPNSLELLVTSIHQFYPTINILIGDDSKITKYVSKYSNIKYFALEYDIGLSASRNYLVDKAITPYVMSLDDDFVFTNATKIEKLYQFLKNHQEIDLASGSLYTDTNSELYDYSGLIAIEADSFKLIHGNRGIINEDSYSCKLVDIVANFFMAKTSSLKKVKWDPMLKLGEHQDFFLRAKQASMNIAACSDLVTVFHKQDHTNPEYKQKRGREAPYIRQFLKKHNLKKFVLYSGLTWIQTLD